jgi:cobalamin biosynthesis Mg chelatase CobN
VIATATVVQTETHTQTAIVAAPPPTTTTTPTTTSGVTPAGAAAAGAAVAAANAENTESDTQWGWIAFGILAAAVLIFGVVWWYRSRHKGSPGAPPPAAEPQ